MTNNEIAAAIKRGETSLLPILWERVQRLTMIKAKDYYNSHAEICAAAGVTLEDLQQEGYFAMIEAVEYFQEETGYTFNTFLRYPLQNAFNSLCGMRRVRTRKRPLNAAESLYKPISEDEELYLLDMIPDEAAENEFTKVEAAVYTQQLHKDLEECLSTLPEVAQEVIRGKYYKSLTMQEIAAEAGITVIQAYRKERYGLRDLGRGRNRKRLEQYRQDIISTHAYRSSFAAWRNTGTSSTEYTVLKLEQERL